MPTTSQAKPAPDLESIANDLATLKEDFATLLADLRAGTVGRARTMAHDTVEQIADKANSLYGQATAQANAGVKALSLEVEERPLTALMTAFAIGFVASRLLSR
jgi:ElaB/YqjD/DUF883 family membrane-anchored ribosome-binding protein